MPLSRFQIHSSHATINSELSDRLCSQATSNTVSRLVIEQRAIDPAGEYLLSPPTSSCDHRTRAEFMRQRLAANRDHPSNVAFEVLPDGFRSIRPFPMSGLGVYIVEDVRLVQS
jgi:hypothetical protein